LFGGIWGRSQALLADAINSLLDIVANIVVWFGIKISERPPDREHPYGHGNADNLAAIFVAIVLFLTGAYIGREAFSTIIDKSYATPNIMATAAAIITILIKFSLYKFTVKIGREYRSPAVIANAQDHRSDVLISLGALIGIVVAQIGFPILDPLAGIYIAISILRQSVKIIRENISTLMVSSPGLAFEKELKEYISNLDEVKKVTWIKGRAVGSGYYIDAAVCVRGDLTVSQGHDIAHDIGASVKTAFPTVHDVLVHIEPYCET
jgi:cation diffusion facilitator family transporter